MFRLICSERWSGLKDESGKGIVACSYAGTLGTPVLFGKDYFDQLKSLNGDQGAKNIVKINLSGCLPR